jgi:hypothetical protein
MNQNEISLEKLDFYVHQFLNERKKLFAFKNTLIKIIDEVSTLIINVEQTIELLILLKKVNREDRVIINWVEIKAFYQYEYRYGNEENSSLYDISKYHEEHILLEKEDPNDIRGIIEQTQEKNKKILSSIEARLINIKGQLENLERRGNIIFIAQQFVAYGIKMPEELLNPLEEILDENKHTTHKPNLKYQDEMYHLFEKMKITDKIKTKVAAKDILTAYNFLSDEDEKESEKIESFVRQYYNRIDKLKRSKLPKRMK